MQMNELMHLMNNNIIRDDLGKMLGVGVPGHVGIYLGRYVDPFLCQKHFDHYLGFDTLGATIKSNLYARSSRKAVELNSLPWF